MQCDATQRDAMRPNVTQCDATRRNAMQRDATQRDTTQRDAMRHNMTEFSARGYPKKIFIPHFLKIQFDNQMKNGKK